MKYLAMFFMFLSAISAGATIFSPHDALTAFLIFFSVFTGFVSIFQGINYFIAFHIHARQR